MIEKDGEINIQDNFLTEEEFVALRDIITHRDFAWHFETTVVSETEEDKENTPGYFHHTVYNSNTPHSQVYSSFVPIMEALDIDVILRMQINLYPRLPEPFTSDFHVDIIDSNPNAPIRIWTTSIFYINTNNGYTEFEDGTIVESVANRVVIFPTNTKHRVVTQTDEKRRMVINFNYLKGNRT